VIRDLVALAGANLCILAAGHGVLRAAGVRPAFADAGWSIAVAYLAGAAAVGVAGSLLLVAGASLAWWQLVLLCAALAALGLVRRSGYVRPERHRLDGWLQLFPLATALALTVLAVDLAVQPLWNDDAWSIWAVKAVSVVELGGLDPAFLGSSSVFNADYPLVVPVLELVALRFCGLPNELVPMQLGLVFLAFPCALAALLRDRARPLVVWTVALAIAVAPTLQVQTAAAVADVPLGVFFALAACAGWRWLETHELPMLVLTALFAAAAASTKVEGAVFVGLLLVALAVAAGTSRRRLAQVGAVAAAVVLTALPWEVWSRRHGIGNAIAEAGGTTPGPIERIPSAAVDLAKELADPSSWLALVALGCAAIALGAVRGERRLAAFTVAIAGASLAAVLAVYWTTPLDFDYHVATSVRRVITAPVLFVAAMTPLLLGRLPVDGERPLGHPRD
jgi:hypothetical protein